MPPVFRIVGLHRIVFLLQISQLLQSAGQYGSIQCVCYFYQLDGRITFQVLLLMIIGDELFVFSDRCIIKQGVRRCELGKFTEVFNYARNNDIKALNKSIENVGHRHHAEYVTNIMFADDIKINFQLLSEIQSTISSLYKVVNDNYLIKKNAHDMLEDQCKNIVPLKMRFDILTNQQLFELVYQQAMNYYFSFEVKNESSLNSYFNETIQYRIVSNFLQSDIEQILIKMYEDIEIVIEDTKNIDFLLTNYRKMDSTNDNFHCILEQLTKGIQNVISQDNKFGEEYFDTVQKISFVLQQNFCGG